MAKTANLKSSTPVIPVSRKRDGVRIAVAMSVMRNTHRQYSSPEQRASLLK